MPESVSHCAPSHGSLAWGSLPRRMRVLYVATHHRRGAWLADALSADSASEIEMEEAVGMVQGLARLRDAVFDAVLLTHEPGVLEGLEFVEALRGGGSEEAVIVLGEQSEQELAAHFYEVGADAYACVNTVTTRTLIWVVARAIQRHLLIRENRRLEQNQQQRQQRETDEAHRLLRQQRDSITAPQLQEGKASPLGLLPEELVLHYRELLRAYVVMGSGSMTQEVLALCDLLASAGVSAHQTMDMHLAVLEDMVLGLGNRSARHVMTRADLLGLEVLTHLADGYRARYRERRHPACQQWLPGFSTKTEAA